MIPKLHKKGKSFRGAALYLLHDKGASTSDRVAWTETRNLATNNPEAAWRVMAATALDQTRLKSEAGIKSTGRKSKDSVLHMTLSWHPDEADGLTREEMLGAAEGALTALKAQDHQVLFVNHDDEPQPHLHILVNRVSPTDGRLLSSSKEKLALSRWAEAYERERGTIFCEERVLNNASRDRGQFTRGQKEKPRHIFELEAGNDNEPWAAKLREEQRQKDLEVRRKQLAQTKRHEQEWNGLHTDHEDENAALHKDVRRQITVAKQRAGDELADDWARLALDQEEERKSFIEREKTLAGKASNILRSIDWTGLLRQERRGTAIKEAFGLLAGREGARSETLRRAQARQTIELDKRELEAKRIAATAEHRKHQARLQKQREQFLIKRHDVLFRHQMEDSCMGAAWLKRKQQRVLAWETARSKEATRAFEKTATPDEKRMEAAKTFMGRMRKARMDREIEKTKTRSLKERLKDQDQDRER